MSVFPARLGRRQSLMESNKVLFLMSCVPIQVPHSSTTHSKTLQLEVKKSPNRSVPSWHPRCEKCEFPLGSWSKSQVWCCKTHHMGCAFDCRDHLSTWQAGVTGEFCQWLVGWELVVPTQQYLDIACLLHYVSKDHGGSWSFAGPSHYATAIFFWVVQGASLNQVMFRVYVSWDGVW